MFTINSFILELATSLIFFDTRKALFFFMARSLSLKDSAKQPRLGVGRHEIHSIYLLMSEFKKNGHKLFKIKNSSCEDKTYSLSRYGRPMICTHKRDVMFFYIMLPPLEPTLEAGGVGSASPFDPPSSPLPSSK
ncbi:hypothetical protein CCFV1_ORF079 [Cotesia congregata filamentous virus 1]|uniref:Uncharacterized protein n=1 Tax=Cotesia congregata filamentous virus 1 TaxID=3064291 RepID=A0ABC8QMY8_9VIRU|nr:hypothetical protein CCFV1_ORF079 [Cotesia congregata filamentous virus 1]